MREGLLVDRQGLTARNSHPTVKPIKLTQWLATLLLPPAAYAPRRLLVPFCGSGSEGIGALLAGWEEIVMIDSDQSYVDIARTRVAYWQERRR
jgi:site-specific DNA-methyltransferase (adenine-specific)